jgi:hypothetical protein
MKLNNILNAENLTIKQPRKGLNRCYSNKYKNMVWQ